LVDYGILATPSSSINASLNAYTGMVNQTNNTVLNALLPDLQSLQLMSLLNIAVQLDNSALREQYTLRLLLDHHNLTFTPVDDLGVPIANLGVLTFSDVASYMVFEPRSYSEASCRVCVAIPVCASVAGCDGFSIAMNDLVTLLPAPGYEVTLNYVITIPGTNSGGTSRRLLSWTNGSSHDVLPAIAGSQAFAYQSVYVNSYWYNVNRTSSTPSNTVSTTTIVATTLTGSVVVLAIVIAVLLYVYRTRTVKSSSGRGVVARNVPVHRITVV
jgi:hypothetical protein